MLTLAQPFQHNTSDGHLQRPFSFVSSANRLSQRKLQTPFPSSSSSSSLPSATSSLTVATHPHYPSRPSAPQHSSSSGSSSSSTSTTRPPPRLSSANGQPSHHHLHFQQRQAATTPPLPPSPRTRPVSTPPAALDIHSYPSSDLLRLLALLLTQIASTNDSLSLADTFNDLGSQTHAPSSPSSISPPSISQPTSPTDISGHFPIWSTLTSASRSSLSNPSSALTFHARNVPTITLEAYLLRILRYCPTTNEVFLSLLVYFDRMSKLAQEATGRTFVIDSYNIHRLVIAGVTVASKFFSDVFYTNSRYAKVGGLPQAELNQLELQFLLLNDFNLVIPCQEMQRYAEQLIIFSQSHGASSTPEVAPGALLDPPSISPHVTAPAHAMQAMGAIDAYGGSVPLESPAEQHRYPSSASPRQVSFASALNVPSAGSRASHVPRRGSSRTSLFDEDAASEAGTETETEGGYTTDDELTIRPGGHSVAGSSSGSTSDLLSEASGDDNDADDEQSYDQQGRGDITPEQRQRGRNWQSDADVGMASP